MLLDNNGKKDHITIGNRGLSDAYAKRILDFLHGEVYGWCKNNPGEELSAQKLVGGVNSNWQEPIVEMYRHRVQAGSSDPVKSAGRDCGYFLRRVLQEDDMRDYIRTGTTFPGQHYKWMLDLNVVQSIEQKIILAVRGIQNRGKTNSIKCAFNLFTKRYPNANTIDLPAPDNEIVKIVTVGNAAIGFASKGDNATTIKKNLALLCGERE